MLKILPSQLQQYMNRELPDVQAEFRKGRGTRDQIASIRWIIEKGNDFQRNIYFCFIDYAKTFDCVDHNKLWKILQENEKYQRNISCKDRLDKGQKWYGPNRSRILRKGGKNTQKNCIKKIFTTQIITIV